MRCENNRKQSRSQSPRSSVNASVIELSWNLCLGVGGIVGNFFMLQSQNQPANQIRRSYKNDEFDWPSHLVTVT